MQTITTPYEYVGDIAALGGLQLTKLAKSFEWLESTPLDMFFPDETINERTIVVERVIEGIGIAPIVRMGVPAGNFFGSERIERRVEQPAFTREDDFLDQGLINQIRRYGTLNEQDPINNIIARRTRRLVNRQNRTKDFLRAQVLQGGINYTDPRTNVSINVSTYIPTHNMFRYDGFDRNVGGGADITGTAFKAGKALTNSKGRPEALFFTDVSGFAGVPWTHPNADIIRCLRYIKHYLYNTNKNRYTDLVMSRDLYIILQENAFIKAYSGAIGMFVNADGAIVAPPASSAAPPMVSFGPGGDITAIAGLNIILMDTMYGDPISGEVRFMWPSDLVAIVARNHVRDSSATLGFTHHCVGEAPDGRAGMWMRTGPDQQPPATPGRTMQLGNAFLPFAMYPQWIALINVCDQADLDANTFFSDDIANDTFVE